MYLANCQSSCSQQFFFIIVISLPLCPNECPSVCLSINITLLAVCFERTIKGKTTTKQTKLVSDGAGLQTLCLIPKSVFTLVPASHGRCN